ncbi:uncharacterized protein LOC119096720 [Pollicipes pollicipes]|uniref:uncharacterized protein LOC119096720 n=1 Tax=Pollicipes pollicipes TaxID=41117 RepID=UPI001885455A|nr:uncharacterized protein LOC119096720 [Pollicipes pollicipes]
MVSAAGRVVRAATLFCWLRLGLFQPAPDYAGAILSLETLPPSESESEPTAVVGDEEWLLRREDERRRLAIIQRDILNMLQLPCIPQRPPDAAILRSDPDRMRLMLHRLQSETRSDGRDLLKSAQSFYPSCDTASDWQEVADAFSLPVFFDTSGLFRTLPELATVDIAQLRIFKRSSPNFRRPPRSIRVGPSWLVDAAVMVSVFPGWAPRVAGEAMNRSHALDTVVVTAATEGWLSLDVRAAVQQRPLSGGHRFLLTVTQADEAGRPLPAARFFHNFTCDAAIPTGPVPGLLLRGPDGIEDVSEERRYPVLDLETSQEPRAEPGDGPPPAWDGIVRPIPVPKPCPPPTGAPPPPPTWRRGIYGSGARPRRHGRRRSARGGRPRRDAGR